MINIDFSFVFKPHFTVGTRILNFRLVFINFFMTTSYGFKLIISFSGTLSPLSTSYCSSALCSFRRVRKTSPLSAIISNKFLVIALLFPKARNQTLPLIYSGISESHNSRTRFVRLTLSQFGKMSVIQILTTF